MDQTATIPAVSGSHDDSEMLWGFWYPALRSSELRGRRLVKSMRLEIPLALGRDAAGEPHARHKFAGEGAH